MEIECPHCQAITIYDRTLVFDKRIKTMHSTINLFFCASCECIFSVQIPEEVLHGKK